MTATFSSASAVSTLSRAEDAVAQAWDRTCRRLRSAPDLAFLFVSSEYAAPPQDIENMLRLAHTRTALVGAVTPGVVGGDREIEDEGAVGILGMNLGAGSAVPFSLTSSELALIDDPGLARRHLDCVDDDPDLLVLFCDPYTFDAVRALGILGRAFPGTPVVGGLVGGAQGVGTATLFAPDGVKNVGAVGLVLTGVRAEVVVAQGCRPIGDPLLVTRAERNLIYELGRRPAFAVLRETVERIRPQDRQDLGGALHVGRVINEYSEDFRTGDFLVRNLIGADPDKGVIAVGDVVRSGQTIQFHVRDRTAAENELRRLLRQRASAFGSALGQGGGSLMFTCAGRGSTMFGLPDHDISVFKDETGGGPAAGCFCAGEIGPVGRRSFIHAFTTVITVIGPG